MTTFPPNQPSSIFNATLTSPTCTDMRYLYRYDSYIHTSYILDTSIQYAHQYAQPRRVQLLEEGIKKNNTHFNLHTYCTYYTYYICIHVHMYVCTYMCIHYMKLHITCCTVHINMCTCMYRYRYPYDVCTCGT